MSDRICAALTNTAIALFALFAVAPVRAETGQKVVVNGSCQYSDRVARYRDETVLIVCDTATIWQGPAGVTLDFRQRSWGSRAQFKGDMTGDKMAVSLVALRGNSFIAATGSCEIFRRDDETPSMISCLAQAGSRSIAANFVRSRL